MHVRVHVLKAAEVKVGCLHLLTFSFEARSVPEAGAH